MRYSPILQKEVRTQSNHTASVQSLSQHLTVDKSHRKKPRASPGKHPQKTLMSLSSIPQGANSACYLKQNEKTRLQCSPSVLDIQLWNWCRLGVHVKKLNVKQMMWERRMDVRWLCQVSSFSWQPHLLILPQQLTASSNTSLVLHRVIATGAKPASSSRADIGSSVFLLELVRRGQAL